GGREASAPREPAGHQRAEEDVVVARHHVHLDQVVAVLNEGPEVVELVVVPEVGRCGRGIGGVGVAVADAAGGDERAGRSLAVVLTAGGGGHAPAIHVDLGLLPGAPAALGCGGDAGRE